MIISKTQVSFCWFLIYWFFSLISILFNLIFIYFFLFALILCFSSFSGFLKLNLRLLLSNLSFSLTYAFNAINFPLNTAFAGFHRFCYIEWKFNSKILKFLLRFLLWLLCLKIYFFKLFLSIWRFSTYLSFFLFYNGVKLLISGEQKNDSVICIRESIPF